MWEDVLIGTHNNLPNHRPIDGSTDLDDHLNIYKAHMHV